MSIINADSTGLVEVADTNNSLQIKTGGVSAITIDSSQNVTFNSQGAITVPSGATGFRPTPVNGMIRYNTTTNHLEAYAGGTWQNIA